MTLDRQERTGRCAESDLDQAMAYNRYWSEFYDEAKLPMKRGDGWLLVAALLACVAG